MFQKRKYLDKLRVLTANAKTFFDCADIPLCRPDNVLGTFDNDSVPGK